MVHFNYTFIQSDGISQLLYCIELHDDELLTDITRSYTSGFHYYNINNIDILNHLTFYGKKLIEQLITIPGIQEIIIQKTHVERVNDVNKNYITINLYRQFSPLLDNIKRAIEFALQGEISSVYSLISHHNRRGPNITRSFYHCSDDRIVLFFYKNKLKDFMHCVTNIYYNEFTHQIEYDNTRILISDLRNIIFNDHKLYLTRDTIKLIKDLFTRVELRGFIRNITCTQFNIIINFRIECNFDDYEMNVNRCDLERTFMHPIASTIMHNLPIHSVEQFNFDV